MLNRVTLHAAVYIVVYRLYTLFDDYDDRNNNNNFIKKKKVYDLDVKNNSDTN